MSRVDEKKFIPKNLTNERSNIPLVDVAGNVLCFWQGRLPRVIDGWSMQLQSPGPPRSPRRHSIFHRCKFNADRSARINTSLSLFSWLFALPSSFEKNRNRVKALFPETEPFCFPRAGIREGKNSRGLTVECRSARWSFQREIRN